jgi:hypothetical protein
MSTRSKKQKTRIVLALEMAQTFSTSKAQTKRVFNVGHFHLAPNMTIVFSIHPLHMFGNSHWFVNRRELK